MRYSHLLISHLLIAAAMALVIGACKTDNQPSADPTAEAALAGGGAQGITGKVIETMNAGTYTYVHVDDGTKKMWAAAPQFQVAVGDEVVVPQGAPMSNFESKTLGRSFELIYFVDRVEKKGAAAAGEGKEQMAAAHGAMMGKSAPVELDYSGITKADGGHSVADLFANKTTLAGKDVVVRGKVAKFSANIMGKNWIHLRDGTGSAGTDDLTVTTGGTAKVGDLVLVRGKLSADKDFGFGYKYDVLIEDATVTAE